MVNLEELQKKIDMLLESETTESLTQWFSQHRSMANSYIGEGSYIELNNFNFSSNETVPEIKFEITMECSSNDMSIGHINYTNAA